MIYAWSRMDALHVQAANRRKLAVTGATGTKVMKLNIAMQYLTESSRFAGKVLSFHPLTEQCSCSKVYVTMSDSSSG